MKAKNLELGLTVQVKTKGHRGFYSVNAGKLGTIVAIDAGCGLDVEIEYEDRSTEWGNHKGIKKADKPYLLLPLKQLVSLRSGIVSRSQVVVLNYLSRSVTKVLLGQ